MKNVQLLVSFNLKRSVKDYQHRATVALDCSDVDELINQLEDLKKDHPDLMVEGIKH